MKKKFNINILLFLFAAAFIIVGICGTCFKHLKWATLDMLAALKHGNIYSVLDFKAAVDDISNEKLSYHDQMMDIDSLKNNLLGTRVVFKEDTTVVKSDSGSLLDNVKLINDKDLNEVVSCIEELKEVSEQSGAKFLYCATPRKEYYEQSPGNAENYFEDNYKRFLQELSAKQVPTLDFTDVFRKNNLTVNELFFYTDHHWTSLAGFMVSGAICNELSDRYGFDYNNSFVDLNNYRVMHYPDWFLGSKGKKVGTYFSWQGADDFDLILPGFETSLTEEQPFKNEHREGTFEETVLYMQNMKKDYYNINTYATYSGGDFRLQIMKNNLNPNSKKILLVRDSFGCVVSPFLALQTSELHICDMRNFEYFVGEKLDLKSYISEIRPDYVLVLYGGVSSRSSGNGKYDFFE